MRIGELNRLVSIERASRIDDGTASVDGPPVTIGQRWARKTDISDGERVAAGELGTFLASRFVMRADTLTRSIGGKNVIRYQGTPYYVVGVKELGRRGKAVEITTASRSDQS